MRKSIDLKKFQALLESSFPEIKFGIGYGSGFFQQKNYDYSKEMPLLDLMFVVEDRLQWHSDNLKRNKKHYGGLSYIFGAGFINRVQNMFSPIHYNPFINLEEFKIKYGVISEEDFKNDMNNWETLIVSGRLHKPVKQLIGEGNYNDLLNRNLRNAVVAALLLDGRTAIKDKELFFNIASLSYVVKFIENWIDNYAGDIRFAIKGESKDKIINIVEGQYVDFKKLYYPILKSQEFSNFLKLDEQSGLIFPNFSNEDRHNLIEMLPSGLGGEIESQQGDFKKSLFMRLEDQRGLLKDAISDINSATSKRLIIYHFLTVSPIKNIKYALNKFSKGFSSKK